MVNWYVGCIYDKRTLVFANLNQDEWKTLDINSSNTLINLLESFKVNFESHDLFSYNNKNALTYDQLVNCIIIPCI